MLVFVILLRYGESETYTGILFQLFLKIVSEKENSQFFIVLENYNIPSQIVMMIEI